MKLFLLCCLLFLSCCTAKQEKTSQKVLRINFQDGDLPSTHPHFGIDYRMRSLQSALFEGLTRMDRDGTPKLAAAEEVFISDDHISYTFKLRPSKWSNGDSVTAFQFEKAWKMAIDKGSACRRPDLFYIVKNAEKIKKGEVSIEEAGIRAIDDKTFEVLLEHPAPYFLELISNPIFSPLVNDVEEPNLFNGPFVISEWKRDKSLSLKKNPLYWDHEHVSLDEIDILFITDPYTAVQLFEKGELDWIGSPFSCLPADMIPSLQKKQVLRSKEVARVYWLYCNTEMFPFHNASIRKALSLAIDRNEIVQHVLLGQAAAGAPLPNSLSLLNDTEPLKSANMRDAQFFFNQGLQQLGIAKEDFSSITLSHSHISGQRQLAEVIQSQWQKNLGIKVQIVGYEWNQFFADLSSGKFHIGGCIKSALFKDPIYHLELLQDKKHSYNISRWEDPDYQRLLKLACNSKEKEERDYHLKKAEEILLDQMPVIPIYSEVYLYLLNPSIEGIVIQDLGHVDFKWTTIIQNRLKD